jgi:hypothetical protein
MAPTIFITGISGYIGGQFLHDVSKKHPEYQIQGLVRTEEQQKKIASKYPSIQTVIGDLDSADVLNSEAAKADVILRTHPSHPVQNSHTDSLYRTSRRRPQPRRPLPPLRDPEDRNVYSALRRSLSFGFQQRTRAAHHQEMVRCR